MPDIMTARRRLSSGILAPRILARPERPGVGAPARRQGVCLSNKTCGQTALTAVARPPAFHRIMKGAISAP